MKHIVTGAFAALVGLATPALAQHRIGHHRITLVAGGIAELISSRVDGYSAVAVVTGATVENMSHIATGESEFALGIADVLTQALGGTGHFEGREIPLRAIAAI